MKLSNKTDKEIKVLTGVDRKYFPSLISHAKLFVMASKHEEYPVSLVETMACGTPFLSTDAGCSRILPGGITTIDKKELSMFMNFLEQHPEILLQRGSIGKDYANNNNKISVAINRLEKIILSL